MFWDRVAGIYDVFVNVINRRTHQKLKRMVSDLIKPDDIVLECACGTGLLSAVIAPKCRQLTATDFSERGVFRCESLAGGWTHTLRRSGHDQAPLTAGRQ